MKQKKLNNIQLKLRDKFLKKGVKMIAPETVFFSKSTKIGKNVTIEPYVVIADNVSVGNNVRILDGAILGKKGFGFLPDKKKNLRYPHIGMVVIADNVEIGCNMR